MGILARYLPRFDDANAILKKRLEAGESILASCWGMCGDAGRKPGLLAVTDKRIIRFSKVLWNEQLISCPFSSVTLVEETEGIFGTKLVIHFQKGFITFRPSGFSNEAHYAKTLAQIHAHTDAAKKQSSTTKSFADDLESLQQLLDKGLINKQEFEDKKKEILARI